MPLKPGQSKAVVAENIREFHGGPTYENTLKKFGKARADAQAVAVALESARKSRGGKHGNRGQGSRRAGSG